MLFRRYRSHGQHDELSRHQGISSCKRPTSSNAATSKLPIAGGRRTADGGELASAANPRPAGERHDPRIRLTPSLNPPRCPEPLICSSPVPLIRPLVPAIRYAHPSGRRRPTLRPVTVAALAGVAAGADELAVVARGASVPRAISVKADDFLSVTLSRLPVGLPYVCLDGCG